MIVTVLLRAKALPCGEEAKDFELCKRGGWGNACLNLRRQRKRSKVRQPRRWPGNNVVNVEDSVAGLWSVGSHDELRFGTFQEMLGRAKRGKCSSKRGEEVASFLGMSHKTLSQVCLKLFQHKLFAVLFWSYQIQALHEIERTSATPVPCHQAKPKKFRVLTPTCQELKNFPQTNWVLKAVVVKKYLKKTDAVVTSTFSLVPLRSVRWRKNQNRLHLTRPRGRGEPGFKRAVVRIIVNTCVYAS